MSGTRAALEALLVRITETPAPTFEEDRRAALVADCLRGAGLEPERDEVGNVIAELPGEGPHVTLAAHLDTVFPAGTDLTVRRQRERLAAPGVGDNSASLAVMLHYALHHAAAAGGRPRLTLAATVGEEGLGDLRGARHLVATRPSDLFVALDGHLGTVVASAVGSKRFEVELRASGGHSWGDFPSPSAVHALGDAIHALNRLKVPREPRSSYNIGEVSGGRAVNAIAQQACFNLDLRSLDPEVLAQLEREALARVRRVARHHGVEVDVRQVGDRPAARVDNGALVRAARQALAAVRVEARVAASSTDANAAMACGIPAICFGVYRGGDAHRLSEWLEPASLEVGYRALLELLQLLARLAPVPAAGADAPGATGR